MITPIKTIHSILLIILIPIILPAQGWIMEEEDGTVTIVSGDRIKVVDPEEGSASTVFNLADRTLLVISNESRSYAEGTMDEYCEAIQAWTAGAMEGLTPEQKKMMEAYMKEAAEGPAPEVSITRTDEEEEIAGYSAGKYEVMVDGDLYEEVWISHDGAFDELVSLFKKIEPITTEMVSCASLEINIKNDPEYSDAYLEMQRSGILMKSMRYEFGSPQTGTNVVRIERKNISASEFSVPEGYTRVTFEELLRAQGTME